MNWDALLKFEVDRAELAEGTIPEILKSPHLIVNDVLIIQRGVYGAALQLESLLAMLDDHRVEGPVLEAAEALQHTYIALDAQITKKLRALQGLPVGENDNR